MVRFPGFYGWRNRELVYMSQFMEKRSRQISDRSKGSRPSAKREA